MDYLLEGLKKAFYLLYSLDAETYSAIWTSFKVSTGSILASLLLGLPLGFGLGYYSFPGQRVCKVLVETLLSFPTVVIGLLVYAFLSRQGPLGEWGLLFSTSAIIIGQTLLGLPIVIAFTATGIENLDKRLKSTLLTLGANPGQVLLTTLWEARFSLLTAAAMAYGRIISEVGISMLVGGNIKWYTRTITTAIALETNKGKFEMGIALGLVLLVIALLVNLVLAFFRRRAHEL